MKGKQTKNNSNDFRATDSEFWKKHHGYDDKKAEKASDWMSKHYSDLGETVKINECDIQQLVSEALKKIFGKLNETEYTSLKSKDTSRGKVGVSKDEDDNYYVDYDGKHYHVPSQEDADKWHEILSIDESRIKAIVKESLNSILKEEEENPALNEKSISRIVSNVLNEILDNDKRNVTRIRITGLSGPCDGRHKDLFMGQNLLLRYARNIGDEENVNNTVLGRLRQYSNFIQFEIIE